MSSWTILDSGAINAERKGLACEALNKAKRHMFQNPNLDKFTTLEITDAMREASYHPKVNFNSTLPPPLWTVLVALATEFLHMNADDS